MRNDVKVSICIPTYNMAKTLEDTVLSACNQTYKNVEIVIQNNCSTDSTDKIISSIKKLNSNVLSFNNDKHISMSQNWNAAVRNSSGDYFVLLCADDLLSPTFVERCVDVINSLPEIGYIWTERVDIDEDDNVIRRHQFYQESCLLRSPTEGMINLSGGHAVPSQVLIKRKHFDCLGGYDETLQWCHDRDLLTKIGLEHDTVYLSDALCHYRYHDEMSTKAWTYEKLGVMELYRMRLSIAKTWSKDESDFQHMKELISTNLAKLCHIFSKHFADIGDHAKSEEYRHLMHSFRLDYPDIALAASRSKSINKNKIPQGAVPLNTILKQQPYMKVEQI